MQNKRRIYSPSQEALEVIKDDLTAKNLKSNNSTAVNYAVKFTAELIAKYGQVDANTESCTDKKKKSDVLGSLLCLCTGAAITFIAFSVL